MSSSLNRALLVLGGVGLLAVLALLPATTATGQNVIIKRGGAVIAGPGVSTSPGDNPDALAAISYPTDNKLKRKLEAAQDFIKEELWNDAVEVLQGLLTIPEDFFVQVGRIGPDGKEIQQWVSVRAEANRLVGSLPPKGMEFYRQQMGPKAAEYLKQAEAQGDKALLAQVSQSYFYTDAGAKATDLLGTLLLDRGDFATAAQAFQRLIDRFSLDKLPPLTQYKAFLAFSRCNDKASEQMAEEIWKQLGRRAPDGVRMGSRLVALNELKQQRDKLGPVSVRDPNDCLVFLSSPNRTAQGIGGTPFLEIKWKQPTIRDLETKGLTRRYVMDQAVKQREQFGDAILPAFFPVAAKGRLVYRSYWGIHAVDLKKDGRLLWESPSAWSLDRMLAFPNKASAATQWINLYFQMQRHHVLWENSTVGTLSTDNTRVFAIEDLALPPVNVYAGNPWGANPNLGFGKEINDAITSNRLQAFNLENGKFLWELGGPVEKKDGEEVRQGMELKESYFLGPPLPIGGKLYVLNEKNQEIRLVCLEPSTDEKAPPKVAWMQTLATTRDKLIQDVARRMQAAHLAYGEGILVCPTNAGAIIGVDLLTHSLQWVYLYREPGTHTTAEEELLMRQGIIPPRRTGQGTVPGASEWKTSAPMVQDGKVVFTAHDGTSIHCLNLRDGSLVWKANRAEKDLYLAGVYAGKVLIVGKESARALDLNDGKVLWQLPTGLPSGRGIASENIYYLPLKSAAATKEPEVCAIDLEKGVVAAHTKSRKKEVPGNLLFYEGDVVSQTVSEVCAYPQLKVKLQEIDELIARNPNDPKGLTERGELRLDRGDLAGAVADLREALKNNPPADVLPKTKLKLYETLTELLQRDFNAGEKYLDEYKEMCKVEISPNATAEERRALEAEQQDRQANYLCLLAKGREAQGRLVDAFEAYQEFGVLAANKELISVVDEPAVKARPDVWAQGRIAAMVAKAKNNPAEKKKLEARIAQKYQQIKQQGSLDELRQFVVMFGSLFETGKEAWLNLAERLIEEQSADGLLEAERHLLVLRHQDDPKMAGRAVEALARLMARRGLLEDAAHYYRVLGRDFAQVELFDGKTGADIVDELATDKRFLPYLDEPGQVWQRHEIKWEEQRVITQQTQVNYIFQHAGEALPYFQQHRVALNLNLHQLKLFDRGTGEEKASVGLKPTNFQNFVYQGQPNNSPRFSYYNVGHLIVLPLGHLVFGIDPLSKQVLWEKSLFGSAGVPPLQQILLDPKDGTLLVVYQGGYVQRLGQAGPVQPSYVCLQTRDGLVVVEPASGKTLWTRSDITPRCHLFGDDRHIFVVDVNADGTTGAARALRAYDGVSIRVPDFSALYQRRVRTVGRNLLLTDTDPQGNLTLRLYDVLEGKDLWKKNFGPNAVVLHTEDPNLAGAIAADGTLTVVDLATRTELLPVRDQDGKPVTLRVEPKHLEKAQAVHLLRDSLNYYLFINGPNDANAAQLGGLMSNFIPGTGIRTLPVNGYVYGFKRHSAGQDWHTLSEVRNQMVILESFEEMPMLLFTARYQKVVNNGANRFVQLVGAFKSVDKRNGKLLCDLEVPNAQQCFALNVDARAGRVELVNYQQKIIHYVIGAAAAEAGKAGAGGAAGTRTGAAGADPARGRTDPELRLIEEKLRRMQREVEVEQLKRQVEQELLRRQQQLEEDQLRLRRLKDKP